MGKIICDICGTSYPDTAEQCPICGCTREAAAQMLGDTVFQEEPVEDAVIGGHNASQKKKEIFDFDEVNSEEQDPEDEEVSVEESEEDEEEDTEEKKGPNVFVVILLTVLIAALLLAAGFLAVRYILPNMGDKSVPDTADITAETQSVSQTEPAVAVPCETLVLSSGNKAMLKADGGKFLLHVSAIPSDTTDKIVFSSADESVATVSADGRIEAVGKGETVVTITCGAKSIECQVVVADENDIAETTAETAPDGTDGGSEQAPAETKAPVSPSDVKLKLKLNPAYKGAYNYDIRLGVYYEYTLELNCNLEQADVQWSSDRTDIATVDANGVVKALNTGNAVITAKYGDQEITCIVRCFRP